MIDSDEIDAKADELGVNTSNVQRDYVFGWVLAGIYSQSELGELLVLKGGNCLRKAYFPFGRFSNDLDFSTSGRLELEFVASELNKVCNFVQENTGVEFDTSRTVARPKRSVDDDLQVIEAKLYFRDFYGEESPMIIDIRLDVTEFDRLHLPVQSRYLIHAYSDYEQCKTELRCVKLEEQLASKLKCLLQRRHVADLFDFVLFNIIKPDFEVSRSEIVSTFFQKTIFGRNPGVAKGLFLDLPLAVFRELWDRYIVCPIVSRFDFSAVGEAFRQLIEDVFGTVSPNPFEVQFFPASLRNPIMQAGHSLTLLDVTYHGKRRQVEPYSLVYKVRQDGVGREYLYVYDRTGGSSGPGIKVFVASGIGRIENTDEPFEPRLPVELTKAGELSGSLHFDAQRQSRSTFGIPATRSQRPSRSSHRYTVECSVCGKRFYRDKYSTRLNPHKDKYGNRCLGRSGYMV